MLGDELQDLKRRIKEPPAVCICGEDECKAGIIHKWMMAGFSHAPEDTLRRYFTWHLRELSSLSVALPQDHPAQALLLALTDHLFSTYPGYCDLSLTAPPLFCTRGWLGIKGYLNESDAEPGSVFSWLLAELSILSVTDCSFLRLEHITRVARHIGEERPDADELISLLVRLNFNHLEVYSRITAIWAELPVADLLQKHGEISSLPVKTNTAFDPDWPSLKDLLCGWLKEMTACAASPGASLAVIAPPKLHFNTSVAHLAFLVRLLREEGMTAAESLTELFAQVCSSVRTKKQPMISEGSLSKEFYGTDQHTAARVRDLLQRMLARINRKYFPVAVIFAIGGALGWLS